jgi:hypothetical protein
MAAIVIFVVGFIVIAALEAASAAWGVDSRESFQDDHLR